MVDAQLNSQRQTISLCIPTMSRCQRIDISDALIRGQLHRRRSTHTAIDDAIFNHPSCPIVLHLLPQFLIIHFAFKTPIKSSVISSISPHSKDSCLGVTGKFITVKELLLLRPNYRPHPHKPPPLD